LNYIHRRNYIHYEKIPVRLVSSGRDKDYLHDGVSHWAEEDKRLMKILSNIHSVWPENTNELPAIVENMINSNNPWYVNLRR
jgi:transketolase C-terminal domain/subunit